MPKVRSHGIDLYYEMHGSGDPLLLIMGISAPGSVWTKHAACWAQHFTCITVDNRGVGKSDAPVGPYTTAQMADDYAGLLLALNINKVRVVGVSMGSAIAQQLALRHPDKIESMVLLCPWARCDTMTKAVFQHIINCKRFLDAETFSLFIQLLIFAKPTWDDPASAQQLAEDRKNAGSDGQVQSLCGIEGQAQACINHDVLDQLHKVQIPVLVLGGKEDIFSPPWMTEEVAAAISGAEIYMYEKSGHAFHWERLADFNNRVLNWLLAHPKTYRTSLGS